MFKLAATRALAIALACAGASLTAADRPPAASPSPDRALHQLVDGNIRYIMGAPAAPRRTSARREKVARGQHPIAAILSCADSRVPVEVVLDQGLGDIFSVRVAGNVADVTEIASLEYAVEHLHVPVIIVLGHTRCGAVAAAAGGGGGGHLPPNIEKLVAHIAPAVHEARQQQPALTGEALVAAAVKRNAFHTVHELLAGSAILREAVESRKVKLVAAVYDLESGKVDFAGEHPGQRALLTAHRTTSVTTPAAQAAAAPQSPAPASIPAQGSAETLVQANQPQHVMPPTAPARPPAAHPRHAERQEADARPAQVHPTH